LIHNSPPPCHRRAMITPKQHQSFAILLPGEICLHLSGHNSNRKQCMLRRADQQRQHTTPSNESFRFPASYARFCTTSGYFELYSDYGQNNRRPRLDFIWIKSHKSSKGRRNLAIDLLHSEKGLRLGTVCQPVSYQGMIASHNIHLRFLLTALGI
jgi:hypothetical protein